MLKALTEVTISIGSADKLVLITESTPKALIVYKAAFLSVKLPKKRIVIKYLALSDSKVSLSGLV